MHGWVEQESSMKPVPSVPVHPERARPLKNGVVQGENTACNDTAAILIERCGSGGFAREESRETETEAEKRKAKRLTGKPWELTFGDRRTEDERAPFITRHEVADQGHALGYLKHDFRRPRPIAGCNDAPADVLAREPTPPVTEG